jgi:hypothetical protein
VVDLVNVGPDAPIVTNEKGGQQSHVAYRYDLIPPEVLSVLARIYDYGAKRYEPDNWKKISTEDHLNHVMVHLVAYRAGDKSDDHLGHMMWRAQAALYTAIHDLGYDARQADEKNYDVDSSLGDGVNNSSVDRVDRAQRRVLDNKGPKFRPCPRCGKVDIDESAGICSACDAVVNYELNRELDEKAMTDFIAERRAIKDAAKMCSECHENPIRYPGAGYCEECHAKWYGQKMGGSE